MIIAQVTDTHIRVPGKLAYGVVETAGYLERAIAAVNALDPLPDVLAMTGDLVDFGMPAEYERLKALLAPARMPVLLIPGNHDEREAMRAAFADHAYLPRSGFLQFAVDDFPVRIVGLDSVVPGKGGGTLCRERLEWLDRTLAAAPRKPTVLLIHHPPFPTFIGHMDKAGLDARDGLAAVVARHPQVERVLCGHLHRAIQARFAGTIASTAPSPAHQVALDLRPGGPSAFKMEPPAYQLHAWREGVGIISHLGFIGRFDGPFPFFKEGKLIG